MIEETEVRINNAYVAILKLGENPTEEEIQKVVDDESVSNFDLCFYVRSEYPFRVHNHEQRLAGIVLAKRGYPYVKDVLIYLLLWFKYDNDYSGYIEKPNGKDELYEMLKKHNTDPFLRKTVERYIKFTKGYRGGSTLRKLLETD